MQDLNEISYQLDYYRQRQFKPGWQDLVQVLFSGILSSADDDDGRDFLYLMGSHLARKHPLSSVQTVGDLEDGLNRILSCFDWGHLRIDARERELILSHYAYPTSDDPDREPLWILSFATVLEGAYAEWLLAQGGQQHVSLHWQEKGQEGVLVFCYKNEA